jgi:hypothetical protein
VDDGKQYAQIAYEAYAAHQEEPPITSWHDLRSDIQEAWGAAVNAVLDAVFPPNR